MFYSTLGAREKGLLYQNETYKLNQRLFLGWRHAYNDLTSQTIFNFASGSSPFLISGTALAKDSLLVDASLELARPSKELRVSIAYLGQYASHVQDNGVAARFSWQYS